MYKCTDENNNDTAWWIWNTKQMKNENEKNNVEYNMKPWAIPK